MTEHHDIEKREKKEAETRYEATTPGKYFSPYTDIYETDDALTVLMDMPGVEKKNVNITLDRDRLSVEGRIDFSAYENLRPVYTEYNVGHFTRAFTLSSRIDRERISAEIKDGVLTLRLPKAEEAKPRRIEVG